MCMLWRWGGFGPEQGARHRCDKSVTSPGIVGDVASPRAAIAERLAAAPRREPGAPPRRRRVSALLAVVNALFYIARTGCQWRRCRVIFCTTRRSSVTFTRGATTARCSGSILSCWCLGTPSDIKSDCWATSSRIRERLPPEMIEGSVRSCVRAQSTERRRSAGLHRSLVERSRRSSAAAYGD